jgi:IS5 family transposase
MKQQTLAMAGDLEAGFERYRRPTRRDEFLATMNAIVPWAALYEVVQPHYPKGVGGRPPISLERMLRIHFIQHWFNLADDACEEALYYSASLRRFAGIDPGREPVPDATTLLKFRRLLNEHKFGEKLFAKLGEVLQQSVFKLKTGTIVDATIIGAPSSTKNVDNARDPEMHQTRKGNQWYFGMKLHIGVDSRAGLAHSAVVTAANVHDKHALPSLLHGNE